MENPREALIDSNEEELVDQFRFGKLVLVKLSRGRLYQKSILYDIVL